MKSIGLLALVIVCIGCSSKTDSIHPVRRDITQAVYASGKIYPLNFTQVSTKVPGIVQEIFVREGDSVVVGQQQRVAIARALMNNPKILFGDEPTGNLDTKNTSMVLDILQELKSEFQQTILMVTHDLQFAQRADRVIAIRDGRIVLHEQS